MTNFDLFIRIRTSDQIKSVKNGASYLPRFLLVGASPTREDGYVKRKKHFRRG